MASVRKYVVTGRYMNGTEVVGYHLVSNLDAEQKKVTREQFIFMLGHGDIANCSGRLYSDQVIIRSTNDININDLPIYDERSKDLRKVEDITSVKPKSGDMSEIMGQLTLVRRIMQGRDNVGFEVRNYGGEIGRLPREKIMELAEKKMISNAVVQNLTKKGNTKKILRGAGIDLRSLPVIMIGKD